MTNEEAKRWEDFMTKSAGYWAVDPIHNGRDRDLIAFVGLTSDPTKGVYVNVELDGSWEIGRYEHALPHIGDAIFEYKHKGKEADYDAALKFVIERMGLAFLLALTGNSVYRVGA